MFCAEVTEYSAAGAGWDTAFMEGIKYLLMVFFHCKKSFMPRSEFRPINLVAFVIPKFTTWRFCGQSTFVLLVIPKLNHARK